jgi:hypothetical protein
MNIKKVEAKYGDGQVLEVCNEINGGIKDIIVTYESSNGFYAVSFNENFLPSLEDAEIALEKASMKREEKNV